jgi:hypothetical protein
MVDSQSVEPEGSLSKESCWIEGANSEISQLALSVVVDLLSTVTLTSERPAGVRTW